MIEDVMWKVLAFILAAVLMFAVPMMSMFDRQDAITYSVAFSAVNEATDISRELGQLNELQYLRMMDTLNATGNTYDVQLEHYRKVHVPVYDDMGMFQDTYETVYLGTFNPDILEAISVDGYYAMSSGDLFYIHVENASKTKAQVVRELLQGERNDLPVILVRSGGMVYSEFN